MRDSKQCSSIPTYRRHSPYTDKAEAAQTMNGRLNAYIKVNSINHTILSKHNAIGGKKMLSRPMPFAGC